MLNDPRKTGATSDEAVARSDNVVSHTWEQLGLEGEPPGFLELLDHGDGLPSCSTEGAQLLVRLHHVMKYNQWVDAKDGSDPPLAKALRAWPVAVNDLDTRDRAIAPQSLLGWVDGDGFTILTHSRHDNGLPIRPGMIDAEPAILPPPGPDKPAGKIVPAPALMLADEAGFGRMSAGSGARMDKRLLIFSIAAVPMHERRPGGRYTLRPSLRTIVHDWLMPPPAVTGTGMGLRSCWRPARHAPTLRRAMQAVNLSGVILPDGREWLPVIFRAFPDFGNLDSRATIEIALPELPPGGPMIARPDLIAAGVVSDMAFDGSLTLATMWDRAKARNGGHRIYATRPDALRNEDGILTRMNGTTILGAGNNPVGGKDGRLQWREGDVPQRDWRHPEAVIVGEERHPQADKVPVLDRDDRRRLFYGHGSDGQSKRMHSYQADQADKRLQEMERQGRIVIEDCGHGGRRILELPKPFI